MSVSGVRSSCDMLVKKCMIVDYIELFVDDIEALVVGAGPNVAVLVDSHRYHAQEVAELFLDFQFRHLAVGRVYRAADYQIVVVAYPEPTEGVEYHLLYEVVRERLECARRGAVEVSHLVRPGVEYAQAVASGAEPQVAVGVGHHAGHEVVAQGLYEFAVGVEKARGIGHHGPPRSNVETHMFLSRSTNTLLISADWRSLKLISWYLWLTFPVWWL